jgi:hypothetical protein
MKPFWRFALLLSIGSFCSFASQAQQATNSSSQNGSQTSGGTTVVQDGEGSADKKGKKVWTDDDLHKLGDVSVVGERKPGAKARHSAGSYNSKDATAANYKTQLEKLQQQLDETNKKIAELQNFNGDSSSDTRIQTNHRLTRASVADQIVQLEAKKKQLEGQMQSIYDQARRNGIEPGALR